MNANRKYQLHALTPLVAGALLLATATMAIVLAPYVAGIFMLMAWR